MNDPALIAGVALVAGLLAAVWRLTRPKAYLWFGPAKLHFTPAVPRAEAERLGRFLVKRTYRTDARVTKEGDVYQLQFACGPGRPTAEQELACEVLAAGLADEVFDGAAVEVRLGAASPPAYAVRHRGRFGRRLAMNAAEVFYTPGVTDDEALNVATFLAGVGLFDDAPKLAQLNRTPAGYEFRLAVDVDPLTPEMAAGQSQMSHDLTRVLKAPATAHFCAGVLGTLLAVESPTPERSPGGPYHSRVYVVPPGVGRPGAP